MVGPPGSKFEYCNGLSHLLSVIINTTTKMNMVVVFTGGLPSGKLSFPFELTMKYIFPAVVSSEPLPTNSRQAERLDHLVNSVSTSFSDGFVWLSREEGIAKDGIFRRARSPKFRFEYPVGSKKLSTAPHWQVMRMKTPYGIHFEASVVAIPDKLKLEEFGPKFYIEYLQSIGSAAEVIANKEIALNCGSRAYRTDIKWTYIDFYQLTSIIVSSYRDNKCVSLVVHTGQNQKEFASIVESLTFE